MKLAVMAACAAVALGGCAKSATRQFNAVCAEQKAHDLAAYTTGEGVCRNGEYLSDAQKMMFVDAYKDLKRARAAVGRERP